MDCRVGGSSFLGWAILFLEGLSGFVYLFQGISRFSRGVAELFFFFVRLGGQPLFFCAKLKDARPPSPLVYDRCLISYECRLKTFNYNVIFYPCLSTDFYQCLFFINT